MQALLGFIITVVLLGLSRSTTVSAGVSSNTSVSSLVDVSEDDDMQTAASTNMVHWINSLQASHKKGSGTPRDTASNSTDEVTEPAGGGKAGDKEPQVAPDTARASKAGDMEPQVAKNVSSSLAGEVPTTPANIHIAPDTTRAGKAGDKEPHIAEEVSSSLAGEVPTTPANIHIHGTTGASEAGDMEEHHEHIAEEAADMNIDPYRNHTELEEGKEHGQQATISKDTETVKDDHVINSNKTHEEEEEKKKDAASESLLKPADASILANPSTVQLLTPPLDTQHQDHDGDKTASDGGATEVAAILGGVLITVAVAGYLGLLAWRRLLERRYGNREMLVNEDDDLHHFEL